MNPSMGLGWDILPQTLPRRKAASAPNATAAACSQLNRNASVVIIPLLCGVSASSALPGASAAGAAAEPHGWVHASPGREEEADTPTPASNNAGLE